jgi:hypothetical protein
VSADTGVADRVPPGWSVVTSTGPGPFVTHVRLEGPDGAEVEWSSRRHRKRLGMLRAGLRDRITRPPSATSIWMGSLFAVGSVCFALGSLPLYFDRAQPATVAMTFFVGSVFFTTASYLQYHEVLRAPDALVDDTPRPVLRSLLGWKPRRIDWWAAVIQLVGTVFFNVSTWAATRTDLTLDQERRLVWAPNLAGSACFLIASWLAYSEVNRGVRPRPDHTVGWRIAAVNLAGSIAFGLAAIGARYLHTTGEPANIALVNAGTFVGALCFLAGAALLPVESASGGG